MRLNSSIIAIAIIAAFIIGLVLVTNLIIRMKPSSPDIDVTSDLLIPALKEEPEEPAVKELLVPEEKEKPEVAPKPEEKTETESMAMPSDSAALEEPVLEERKESYESENVPSETEEMPPKMEPEGRDLGGFKKPPAQPGVLPAFTPVFTKTGPPAPTTSAPASDIINPQPTAATKSAFILPPATKTAPPINKDATPLPPFTSTRSSQGPGENK